MARQNQPLVVSFKRVYMPFDYFRLSRSMNSVWLGVEGTDGNLEICDHRPDVLSIVRATSRWYGHEATNLTYDFFGSESWAELFQAVRANARVKMVNGSIHLFSTNDDPNACLSDVRYGLQVSTDIQVLHDDAYLSWKTYAWKQHPEELVRWIFLTTLSRKVFLMHKFFDNRGGGVRTQLEIYSSNKKTYTFNH